MLNCHSVWVVWTIHVLTWECVEVILLIIDSIKRFTADLICSHVIINYMPWRSLVTAPHDAKLLATSLLRIFSVTLLNFHRHYKCSIHSFGGNNQNVQKHEISSRTPERLFGRAELSCSSTVLSRGYFWWISITLWSATLWRWQYSRWFQGKFKSSPTFSEQKKVWRSDSSVDQWQKLLSICACNLFGKFIQFCECSLDNPCGGSAILLIHYNRTIQLLATFALSSLSFFSSDYKRWIQTNQWLMWISLFGAIGFMLLTYWKRKSYPTNLLFLSGFTLAEAYSISVITSFYNARIVIEALIFTLGIFVALTLFACQSKYDFTSWMPYLFGALWVVILFGFMAAFFPYNSKVELGYGIVVALIFSGYILVDTQLIMRHYHLEEEIAAAISLYLDIINLFLAILRILNSQSNNWNWPEWLSSRTTAVAKYLWL